MKQAIFWTYWSILMAYTLVWTFLAFDAIVTQWLVPWF